MFGVTGLQYIEQLEAGDKFVGVFLTSGLDVSALRWLVDVWFPIHRMSGHRWHLVAPTFKPINDDARLASIDNYDEQLASELTRFYGLQGDDLPCIVLDSFSDEHRQLRVSLPESERERRDLIEAINDYLTEAIPDPFAAPTIGRRRLIEGLYNYLQRRALLRKFVSWLPNIGSFAARAASSAFRGS
ncbi:hypothetical protein [Reyranella sp.]|uniref:hypothetical protein n=1 Tax=Reyranella sp. TaxID=1929291 RepID=UPI0027301CF8|nr:hypothetical protein [Reyranella sp.]MDP2372628.1 hypothetical protein [Reyranella sp.]